MGSHLYIHIPFCDEKCSYCSFYSISDKRRITDYINALLIDIEELFNEYKCPLDTLYLGGGSPSTLSMEEMRRLLSKVNEVFGDIKDELTVELNPKSLSYEYLLSLHESGVNRISMGVQSFDGSTLRLLGRRTSKINVFEAVKNIRKVGFNNLSLDLIYGIPNYSYETLKSDLEEIIFLNPEHISTYCLSLEAGTPLETKLKKYNIQMPNDDETADQLEYIIDRLKKAGYNRYEISNFAKDGMESKHNKAYWNYRDTLGAGSAAVYTNSGKRVENVKDIDKYIDMVTHGKFPYGEVEKIPEDEQMIEYIMMGMRKSEGINLDNFKNRFGLSLEEKYGKWLKKYSDMGLLILKNDSCFFNDHGLNISNGILADLFLEN